MNTAEILALCREAQANPDYVADYPEIAITLITEALPQVCRALELAQADNAKWQAIAQRRSEMQSQSEMDNAKLVDFMGMYRAILRNIQGGKCEDLYLQGAIDNAGHLLSQNHPGAALLEEMEQLRKTRGIAEEIGARTDPSTSNQVLPYQLWKRLMEALSQAKEGGK